MQRGILLIITGDNMKLLEYLYENGITVTGFARRLGVNRCTLSLVANNKRRASPILAVKIEKETNGVITRKQLRPDIFL